MERVQWCVRNLGGLSLRLPEAGTTLTLHPPKNILAFALCGKIGVMSVRVTGFCYDPSPGSLQRQEHRHRLVVTAATDEVRGREPSRIVPTGGFFKSV